MYCPYALFVSVALVAVNWTFPRSQPSQAMAHHIHSVPVHTSHSRPSIHLYYYQQGNANAAKVSSKVVSQKRSFVSDRSAASISSSKLLPVAPSRSDSLPEQRLHKESSKSTLQSISSNRSATQQTPSDVYRTASYANDLATAHAPSNEPPSTASALVDKVAGWMANVPSSPTHAGVASASDDYARKRTDSGVDRKTSGLDREDLTTTKRRPAGPRQLSQQDTPQQFHQQATRRFQRFHAPQPLAVQHEPPFPKVERYDSHRLTLGSITPTLAVSDILSPSRQQISRLDTRKLSELSYAQTRHRDSIQSTSPTEAGRRFAEKVFENVENELSRTSTLRNPTHLGGDLSLQGELGVTRSRSVTRSSGKGVELQFPSNPRSSDDGRRAASFDVRRHTQSWRLEKSTPQLPKRGLFGRIGRFWLQEEKGKGLDDARSLDSRETRTRVESTEMTLPVAAAAGPLSSSDSSLGDTSISKYERHNSAMQLRRRLSARPSVERTKADEIFQVSSEDGTLSAIRKISPGIRMDALVPPNAGHAAGLLQRPPAPRPSLSADDLPPPVRLSRQNSSQSTRSLPSLLRSPSSKTRKSLDAASRRSSDKFFEFVSSLYSRVDIYGFVSYPHPKGKKEFLTESAWMVRERTRARKWMTMSCEIPISQEVMTLVQHGRRDKTLLTVGPASPITSDSANVTAKVSASGALMTFQKTKKFFERYQKGPPQVFRGHVWYHLLNGLSGLHSGLNAAAIDQIDVGLLKDYYTAVEAPNFSDQFVAVDVRRTFGRHIWYMKPNGEGQIALGRVVKGFCGTKPEIGYHYGICLIAAILLLVMEEETYATPWLESLFVSLCNTSLSPAELRHIRDEEDTQINLPADSAVDVDAAAPFPGILPFPLLLRVWDLVVHNGFNSLPIISAYVVSWLEGPLLKLSDEILVAWLEWDGSRNSTPIPRNSDIGQLSDGGSHSKVFATLRSKRSGSTKSSHRDSATNIHELFMQQGLYIPPHDAEKFLKGLRKGIERGGWA
ncbi:hypothetical protein BC832DRAFT_542984 [Gaertneriomyces semiglobifer]|nr:hypothetical protein BC832DRAFT_542984 [Gaertneriomyces semiglobifer]